MIKRRHCLIFPEGFGSKFKHMLQWLNFRSIQLVQRFDMAKNFIHVTQKGFRFRIIQLKAGQIGHIVKIFFGYGHSGSVVI